MAASNPFQDISAHYVKNPLGIIALFIVLVYAIAGIVAASATFNEGQRWVIVGFLTLFPFVVLWVFYELVTKHITKMYSPDEMGAENFVQLHTDEASDTATSDRLRAWFDAADGNRARLRAWMGKRGISASVTLFLNSGDYASLRQAAIGEFGAPETEE